MAEESEPAKKKKKKHCYTDRLLAISGSIQHSAGHRVENVILLIERSSSSERFPEFLIFRLVAGREASGQTKTKGEDKIMTVGNYSCSV